MGRVCRGGGFQGRQAQPGARTVQGELERALSVALRSPVQVNGASRTDAGVHALGQAASLETTSDLPTSKLQRAVNALLPDDVAVTAIDEVGPAFHARFAARGKHYRYRILCRAARSPLEATTAWHLPRPLDLEAMQAAADRLVGRHDFTALVGRASAADPAPSERDCVRTISMVQVGRQPLGVVAVTPGRLDAPASPIVTIDAAGDGFLYKMAPHDRRHPRPGGRGTARARRPGRGPRVGRPACGGADGPAARPVPGARPLRRRTVPGRAGPAGGPRGRSRS